MIALSIAALFSTLGAHVAPSASLEDTLALVPPSAKVIGVVPSLARTNDDLGQLIDGMGRPGTVLAGRPIEMAKAQLGIGPGLDESGSMAVWFERDAEQVGGPVPAFLIPTTDPEGFLKGNFTPAESLGADAWRTGEGEVLYARNVKTHVLLSPSQGIARNYDPGAGVAAKFHDRLGEHASSLAAKGDIVIWSDGEALGMLSEAAAQGAANRVPIDADPQMLTSVTDGATDALLVVDFDPLGLSVRTFARYAPESMIGAFARGGSASGTPMNRLPDNPYYFALYADIAGMGGLKTFRNILDLVGAPQDALPAGLQEGGLELHQMQMAAYPSRLGIALGGLFNDSSLVVTSSDARALEVMFKDALMATKGDSEGIRYEPEWVDDKPLRTGGTANAFRVKETVLPPSNDDRRQRIGDTAIQRMVLQFLYGSRGLSGFAGVDGDAFVMTFSQRPDVWQRALAAAGESGATISDSPVLQSMRSWLIPKPDIEVLLGLGTFTKLLEQVSRTLPMIDPGMIPQIPVGTPPIAFDMEIDKGTIETAVVIPTGVIALGFDQVMREMTASFGVGPGAGGADPGESPRDRGR